MRRGMNHRPEEESIGNLPVEPLRLVEMEPREFGSYEGEDVATHGKQN
jgi:hypothetical protein